MEAKLYCCKIKDSSNRPELMNEFLIAQEFFFSSWEDKENCRNFFTIYAETSEAGASNRTRIEKLIPLWRELGAQIGDLEYFEMEKADWAEVWKKYFHILHITDRLTVRPSWLEHSPKPGETVLTLDPGMSFGTGQHATTSFCLRMLDALSDRKDEIKYVLDAGCGSGILSIAALLLGFEHVEAFDFDPDAVRVAQENIAINKVKLTPFVADAKDYPGRKGGYDLVLANILGHFLIEFRENIAHWVRPGKYLALSGILSSEIDLITEAYLPLGFEELERGTEKEWTSILLRKV